MTAGLPEPLDEIVGSERSFADGQRIFTEGQVSDFAYQVVSGKVELSKSYPEGDMRLAVLDTGDLFGEMGLLDGAVRSATATARAPTELLAFDREQLLSLVRQRPDFALDLVTMISRRLRHANALIGAPDLARITPQRQTPWQRLRRAMGRGEGPALERIRVEFLPDAIEIEERPFPWGAKAILYAILALLFCGTVWASVAEIDRIVIATGKIVTTEAKIVVQPMATATVRAINVRVGQVVEAGDILVALDPTFTTADERSVRSQMLSADAEVRRLEAELALFSGEVAVPGPFSADAEVQKTQAEVFRRFKIARDTLIRSSDAEIREIETHTASLRTDRTNVVAQQAVAQRLEAIRTELYAHGNGSLVNLLDVQRQLAADRREIDRLGNELVEAQKKIDTIRAKREATLGEMSSKAAQELQAARRDVAKAVEQIKKQERMSVLIDLRSPSRAKVLELGARSVGSVVKEGEPLVTLVALDVPVEIESVVDTRDISHLRVGDPVRIKLEAFPYQKYGTLDGTVQSITGDVLDQEEAGRKVSVYKARIAITHSALREVPADFTLMPGMVATCEIKVGTRRLITYVLYPILRTLDVGLREP
jgi:HlyD family secretion protein